MSMHMSVVFTIHMPIPMSIHISIHMPMHTSMHMSIHMSKHMSLHMSLYRHEAPSPDGRPSNTVTVTHTTTVTKDGFSYKVSVATPL